MFVLWALFIIMTAMLYNVLFSGKLAVVLTAYRVFKVFVHKLEHDAEHGVHFMGY